ncbi:LysR family transcriptional regulator [Paracoccus methylarcula]|uniref:LysR family transcriptional regulator n=1 Tax=Paracoccus methylarcula TaxID=72022 RepID=A0A3R7NA69_9RHOB|nr:LysR family transcriptional regulator [Paracoccus methylarcula]RNF33144.1 LysR family transcriptional regulator [Paracoccus methylarcula]
MKDISWDDLKIFLHVAEAGGLSGAARTTGLSAPTIGRRMLALEQQTGQALFRRSQTGYELTLSGEALAKRVRAMRAATIPVQEFLSAQAETPLIRLSAGTGTAMFLADRFAALSRPGDDFRVNFLTTEAVLDIAHRETDLGIRNRPAETGNLASRRLGRLRFAPYRSWSVSRPELMEWVAMDPVHARHPAARWVHRQGHPIRALANSVSTVHQLIKAGVGIGVMPCMIADCDPTLARAGPVIEELTEDQHLVMHDDDRHRPPLRRLIGRLVALYRDNADLLEGERPMRM